MSDFGETRTIPWTRRSGSSSCPTVESRDCRQCPVPIPRVTGPRRRRRSSCARCWRSGAESRRLRRQPAGSSARSFPRTRSRRLRTSAAAHQESRETGEIPITSRSARCAESKCRNRAAEEKRVLRRLAAGAPIKTLLVDSPPSTDAPLRCFPPGWSLVHEQPSAHRSNLGRSVRRWSIAHMGE